METFGAIAEREVLLRLLCTDFRLTLRAAFSWMILQVRLFEPAGIDVSVNLRRRDISMPEHRLY
jgi:hypothetical protein